MSCFHICNRHGGGKTRIGIDLCKCYAKIVATVQGAGIAGINAVLALKKQAPYWPSRTRSYLGVLVDDLSTWEKPEPYRITPGHAEFRLTLRDDSAERRLAADGFRIGLSQRVVQKSAQRR